MSDYMYQLESLLNREQFQLLTEVQNAATEAGVALYLSGGAMRDMLGGFPIRDIDFTFENYSSAKLAKAVAEKLKGLEISEDPVRKIVELRTGWNVTGSLRAAQVEKVSKPGGTPRITPAHLLEDLARRDFTINAIAISLAKASRGLIRDPMNGQSDLESREIRVCYPQAFFEQPIRLVRAVRLRRRMNFRIEERTQRYFDTAIEERWHQTITHQEWGRELRAISEEQEPAEILRDLAEARLLPVPVATLNLTGLERFQSARRLVPGRAPHWPLFLHVVTEGAKGRQRANVAEAFGLAASDFEGARKLRPKVSKLEAAVKSPSLRKPSQVYNAIAEFSAAEILLLMYESEARAVQERLRNYFEKYLPVVSEITEAQVAASGAKPGTPQFEKARNALIASILNAPPPPPPEAAPPGPASPPPTISPQARGRVAR